MPQSAIVGVSDRLGACEAAVSRGAPANTRLTVWASVNVVVDLAGEVLRKPPQLLLGYHPAQALHDSRDARQFWLFPGCARPRRLTA